MKIADHGNGALLCWGTWLVITGFESMVGFFWVEGLLFHSHCVCAQGVCESESVCKGMCVCRSVSVQMCVYVQGCEHV